MDLSTLAQHVDFTPLLSVIGYIAAGIISVLVALAGLYHVLRFFIPSSSAEKSYADLAQQKAHLHQQYKNGKIKATTFIHRMKKMGVTQDFFSTDFSSSKSPSDRRFVWLDDPTKQERKEIKREERDLYDLWKDDRDDIRF